MPTLITTLEELINHLVMIEFRATAKEFQDKFIAKVWEDDDCPDLELIREYIAVVVSKPEYDAVFKHVYCIDDGDAELFANRLI